MVNHQRLGLEIGKIELELGCLVSRIERRGAGTGGDTQEGGGHFRAIGYYQGDPITTAYGCRVQTGERGCD